MLSEKNAKGTLEEWYCAPHYRPSENIGGSSLTD